MLFAKASLPLALYTSPFLLILLAFMLLLSGKSTEAPLWKLLAAFKHKSALLKSAVHSRLTAQYTFCFNYCVRGYSDLQTKMNRTTEVVTQKPLLSHRATHSSCCKTALSRYILDNSYSKEAQSVPLPNSPCMQWQLKRSRCILACQTPLKTLLYSFPAQTDHRITEL